MTITKTKIIKGDIVLVITGDEKGKKGEVLKVYPKIKTTRYLPPSCLSMPTQSLGSHYHTFYTRVKIDRDIH